MNYKHLIRDRNLRLRLLSYLDFIPDTLMLRFQYLVKTGIFLNIESPTRYSEKIQWYKLNYKDPLMPKCVDKYEVRMYIEKKGYARILPKLYGLYTTVDEVDFSQLPNQFVLKATKGGGSNEVIICRNKDEVDERQIRLEMEQWLRTKNKSAGREWVYDNIRPRIICEEYLIDEQVNDLIDYKFMCFNGKIACVFVYTDRLSPTGMKSGIYSREFQPIPYKRTGLNEINTSLEPPPGYEYMIKIAETLSEDFPHVRVDLYNVNGKIFFGELTFYHASGYVKFEPDEFDFILGEKFELPSILK